MEEELPWNYGTFMMQTNKKQEEPWNEMIGICKLEIFI